MSIALARIERVAARTDDLTQAEWFFIVALKALVAEGASMSWQKQDRFEEIEQRLISQGII